MHSSLLWMVSLIWLQHNLHMIMKIPKWSDWRRNRHLSAAEEKCILLTTKLYQVYIYSILSSSKSYLYNCPIGMYMRKKLYNKECVKESEFTQPSQHLYAYYKNGLSKSRVNALYQISVTVSFPLWFNV